MDGEQNQQRPWKSFRNCKALQYGYVYAPVTFMPRTGIKERGIWDPDPGSGIPDPKSNYSSFVRTVYGGILYGVEWGTYLRTLLQE